jgi:acyl-CoA synthetase (AMP-forming)/AMP-acid ligase II
MLTEHFRGRRPSVPLSCLDHVLEHQAKRIPDAPAILAPGRASLTYGGLHQHIDTTRRALRARGIGHRDRVAVMLPNGPEMAVTVVAVAASAACVPMNPAYEAEEVDRYFTDLRPRALIMQSGIDSPARRVALSRGIRVVELSSASDAEAGRFTLTGGEGEPASDEQVRPSDVALLLLTSGTTSRPKIVPLTHANICTSAYAHGRALALRETDRCLNVLPLFHGHGLIATVLASLAAGASVVCTTGFDVNSFSAWLAACQPTWFSAVPTMHQAILAQARHKGELALNCRLRFVRSSSAPLPPRIFAELEQTFETPVIEWYGMGEVAASPIACNPLPPSQRKPGSVGVPVGLDVAIMDEGGTLLAGGQTGQVVVRGPSVIAGYDGNPTATAAAFAGDWLKTGDLGFFDDDGYLFLTGRIREIINRGGEKISPKEVDEVLLEHPGVAEVVTFSIPHATLGEDVASAIVLRPDAVATPKDIRQFAIGRIADFKIPRQVLIVTEIPKGPTGKVQRIGLAAKLGLTKDTALPRALVAPRTPLETMLARRWAEILQVEQIGIHDDFFAIGGDSLSAAAVLRHIHDITTIELEISRFFEAPTVAEVAHYLEQMMRGGQAPQSRSTIVRVPRQNAAMTASIPQERLWKLQHALPDIPFCNIVYALRVTSPVDASVLERSINEMVRRHETLRTTFAVVEDRCVQIIAPQLTVRLKFDDLHKLRRSRKETATRKVVQKELLHRFDLARGPLLRTRLVRLAKQTHLLLISMHQIIQDGWSLGVFTDELATLYDAFAAERPSPLDPPAIQYADFAHWQRRWRSAPEIVAQLDYWREQLHHPLPVLRLATARPRPTTHDLRTARRRVALPAKISGAAKSFSQREGVTLFVTLLAAFKILLHRYSCANDLRVATHFANRNRPDTSGLIGPLVNTAILRSNLGGDPSAREVLRRVRATTLAAFANQDIPFEEVVEILERERGVEPAALAQVMMWLHSTALRPIVNSAHGLAFEEVDPGMLLPLVTMTSFDLILRLRESSGGLVGTCVYNPQLFSVRTVDRLLRNFQKVLEQMVMRPEQPISEFLVSLGEKR